MRPIERMLQAMQDSYIRDVDMVNMLGVSKQRFSSWKQRGSLPKDKMQAVADTLGVKIDWLLNGTKDHYDERLGIRLGQSLSGRYSTPESAAVHSGIPAQRIINAIKGRSRLSDSEYEALSSLLKKPVAYLQRIYINEDNTPEYYRDDDFHNLPSSTQLALKKKDNSTITKPFTPWPSKMEDLNMVFIEDVARRISEATGQPIAQIRNIIHEEIQAHYAPQIDPAYIDTCANIALAEIEEEQGFIFKGKDRDTMLTSLKKEIALTAIEDTKQPMGGDVDSTTRKISNGN